MGKASLSLSINAIVVLILAITMLGLGIMLIQNIFGGASENLLSSLDDIDKQRQDAFRGNCNEDVCVEPFIEARKGESTTVLMAIFNKFDCNIDDANLKIEECQAIGQAACPSSISAKSFSTQSVASNEKVLLPITIKSKSTTPPDTYRYAVEVDGECSDGSGNKISKKKFFDVVIQN